MNTEHVTDRLDDYVEDRLESEDRLAVEAHLDGCESCMAAVRAYDPVTLDDLRIPFDEDDGLRRSVRRAIGRTAVDAAAIAVMFLVVGVLVSLLVIQPLVINRSDRAAVAARAAYEAPMLFSPGVSLSRFTIASGLLGRNTTAQVGVALGSGFEALDDIESEIGILSLDLEWSSRTSENTLVPLSDILPGLDRGTVATVAFDVERPLSIEEAQRLADDPGRDVRLTWAGFDVESSVFGRVGYPLCNVIPTPEPQLFAASSASVGGTVMSGSPSVERALTSARDALGAIASNDEAATALARGAEGAVESLLEAMDGIRSVLSFVVTGPSPEVVDFLDDLGVSGGEVLAIGFYSWGSPVCGR